MAKLYEDDPLGDPGTEASAGVQLLGDPNMEASATSASSAVDPMGDPGAADDPMGDPGLDRPEGILRNLPGAVRDTWRATLDLFRKPKEEPPPPGAFTLDINPALTAKLDQVKPAPRPDPMEAESFAGDVLRSFGGVGAATRSWAAQSLVGLADTARLIRETPQNVGRNVKNRVLQAASEVFPGLAEKARTRTQAAIMAPPGEGGLAGRVLGKARAAGEYVREGFLGEIGEMEELRDEIAGEVTRQGGIPALVAQKVAEGAVVTALNLTIMQKVGATPGTATGGPWLEGAKATFKQGLVYGAIAGARAQGDAEDKAAAAAIAAAYLWTPIASSGMPTDLTAKLVDVALNTGVSVAIGAYGDSVEQAKRMAERAGDADWKKYLAATITPLAMSDVVFSLKTRAARGDPGARAALADADVAAFEKIVPTPGKAPVETVQRLETGGLSDAVQERGAAAEVPGAVEPGRNIEEGVRPLGPGDRGPAPAGAPAPEAARVEGPEGEAADARVKVTTSPDGDATVSVPSKDKPGISGPEQKKYLLAELDKAIEEAPAPDTTKPLPNATVTIRVPGDGTFTLIRDRGVLNEFKKAAKAWFPTKAPSPVTPRVKAGESMDDRGIVEAVAAQPDLGRQYRVQIENQVWTGRQAEKIEAAVSEAERLVADNDGKPIPNLKQYEDAVAERGRKERIFNAIEAMKVSPQYDPLRRALEARGAELPADGDLLNVSVEGKGAPAIRKMQDALAKEIGLTRVKDNDRIRRAARFDGGPEPGRFELDRYWKQVASEFEPEPAEGEVRGYPQAPPASQEPAAKIVVEPDPARRQEIRNSIAEGEMILKSGRSPTGRKMSKAEMGAVQRAVNNSKARIGEDVPAGADITRLAREAATRGAVTLPDVAALNKVRAGWRSLKAAFDPARGVPKPVYESFVKMQNSLDAAALAGKIDRAEVYGVVKGLQRQYGRDVVMQAVQDLQDGTLKAADFSARFGLPAGSSTIRTLDSIQKANEARQKAIAGWPGLSEELRQTITENVHYQTRAYLKFILGDDFAPEPARYMDAVHEVQAGIEDSINKLAEHATAVRGKRVKFDVLNYLASGDDRMLAALRPTRANAARAVLRQYTELRGVIDDLALAGDTVTASMNAEALGKAAQGWVDYYLQREPAGAGARGGAPIQNLQQRYLEGAFRALYGEVTDPAYRQGLTTETQAKMIAHMTFFNRVLAEGEGTVWARIPDQQKGLTRPLGNKTNPQDRKRYGDLAGRFVTPQFESLIKGDQNVGPIADLMKKTYFGPLSFQRAAKLFTPKTIVRNYVTSLTGFALGSGDVFLPTWSKHFAKAHALAARYAAGEAGAMREMRELFEKGAFRPGQTSMTYDIDQALGGLGGKIKELGRKATTAYAFIDFPTKYASFMARMDSGMTPEQAARHVQDLYQNRERIPGVVRTITKLPLADYLGYTYDSIRISGNQVRHAVTAIARGDPRPLLGFVASRALWAATHPVAMASITQAFAMIMKRMRKDDEKDVQPATPEEISQFRQFLPVYDQNTPLLFWKERDPLGRMTLRYAVAGGNTAWPIEDAIIGALQSRQHGKSFLEALAAGVGQSVDEGMYFDTWMKAVVGEDLTGNRTPTGKGLMHAMPGRIEPRRSKIIGDALAGLALDMSISGVANPLRQLYDMKARSEAGQGPDVGIFANTRTEEDVAASALRLVRSYRIEKTDMNRMIRNKVQRYVEALNTSKGMINYELETRLPIQRGASTPEQQAQAEAAQRKIAGYFRDLMQLSRSARAVAPEWYATPDLKNVLTASGLSVQDTERIVALMDSESVEDSQLRYAPNPQIDLLRSKAYQLMNSGGLTNLPPMR